ncbi:MAG: succinate dehydrogenase [Chloroflexi bacterium]|nr:succinate dehydrogenase [Chloroflexota bacterium]
MTTATELTHRKVKVPTNLERRAFLFMRVSGVLLLVLAVGHLIIQHVLSSSGNLTLQIVANTWNNWGWKAYDLLLLIFAITHGFNGLRNILEDYIHNRQTVKVINILLLIFMIITIVWSAVAIASFDPEAARAAANSFPK